MRSRGEMDGCLDYGVSFSCLFVAFLSLEYCITHTHLSNRKAVKFCSLHGNFMAPKRVFFLPLSVLFVSTLAWLTGYSIKDERRRQQSEQKCECEQWRAGS